MFIVKNNQFVKNRLDRGQEAPSPEHIPFRFYKNASNTWSCRCCGKIKRFSEFPLITKDEFLSVSGYKKEKRIEWCYNCVNDVMKYYSDLFKDPAKAWFLVCQRIGYYYDQELVERLLTEDICWEDNQEPITAPWYWVYIEEIYSNPKYAGKTFNLSENCGYERFVNFLKTPEAEELKMSENDRKNRATILSIFHYDPFEGEPLEVRVKLYNDLITMTTEEMAEDLPKSRAAIEIVRGYQRIDKIDAALLQMRTSIEEMIEHEKEIKALTDQKKIELQSIVALSRDNGFSEASNKLKSRGGNTLTGIMREMNEKGFDRGATNKFDIDTTEAMRTVADISFSAIFKQLSFSSADYADMVKEQTAEIRKMQSIMEAQAEELRLLKEEFLRQELIERYKETLIEKEIDPDEIERLVSQELQYVPFIEYNEENTTTSPNSNDDLDALDEDSEITEESRLSSSSDMVKPLEVRRTNDKRL